MSLPLALLPKRVLLAGVCGPQWGQALADLRNWGHDTTHHPELPDPGSLTYDLDDFDLVALGVSGSPEEAFLRVRELCAQAERAKMLLLGEPPEHLAPSEIDPWGKLAYVPLSDIPQGVSRTIVELLNQDWWVWGTPATLSHDRPDFACLQQHLRPLQLTAVSLFRHLRKTAAPGEFAGAIREFLEKIVELFGCASSSWLAWDGGTRELVVQASVGPRAVRHLGVRHKLGESLAGWVAELNRPLLVWDLDRLARFARRPKRGGDRQSFMCVPVSEGDQLFGVLTANAADSGPCTTAMLAAFSELATELACALALLPRLNGMSPVMGPSRPDVGEDEGTPPALEEIDNAELTSIQAFQNLPIGVFVVDRNMKVVFINERGTELLPLEAGSSVAGAFGASLSIGTQGWLGKLACAIDRGERQDPFQVRYESSAGRRQLHMLLWPWRGRTGRLQGALVVVTDATDKALLQERLAHVERQALLGERIAGVAHDLNNSLDGIIRFVNLALRHDTKPEVLRSYLEAGRTGLHRMAGTVARLLTYSRGANLGSGRSTMDQVITEAVQLFGHRAKDQGVTVETDISDPIPEISHPQLFELFTNLIKNALEAMPGGGRLSIRTGREGREAVVTVRDTGCGMTDDVKQKLFQPFFTTKQAQGGTGLGLAMAQDLVHRLHGTIQVESSPGEGATFTIRLPIPS